MLPENNIRNFVIKILLCSFGLLFGVSILAPRAHLQNQSLPANANAAANINAPTPRPKVKSSANTAGNTAAVTVPSIDNTPVIPMPTPPANSTVRGRVFYADTGRAVKRASIMLIRENTGDGPGEATGLTDNEGNFQIKKIRAGTYYPMINAPGVVSPLAYADVSKMMRGSDKEAFENAFKEFAPIIVDGMSDVYVQIPAIRGGAIGGRVMYDDGDAAIGVKVEVLRKVKDKFLPIIPNFSSMFAMFGGSGGSQTDDRGVYRFSGLPPGEYIVKVTESTAHSDNTEKTSDLLEIFGGGSSFLTIFYPDATTTKSAGIINLELGQEIGEINLTIPSRSVYNAEGKIIAAKDKSPVKGRVIISRESDDTFSLFSPRGAREQSSVTDENGNWKFKELPKGTYRIVVEPFESESDYQSSLGNYSNMNAIMSTEKNLPPKPKLAKKAQEITIEDKDLSDVVVELGYGATISGTVVVENSREMPSSVTIQTLNESDKLAVTDQIGNYFNEFEPKPEKNNNDFRLENVTVGKNRLNVRISQDEFYVKSATVNGIDLLANPLEVKEGDILRNVQIVLGKGVGTLKGKVLNEKNAPVRGAAFSLVPVDVARRRNISLFREVKTNREGEFEIKMAPGEYAIVIFDGSIDGDKFEEFLKWLDTAIKDAQKVRIEAGKTETVSIKNFK